MSARKLRDGTLEHELVRDHCYLFVDIPYTCHDFIGDMHFNGHTWAAGPYLLRYAAEHELDLNEALRPVLGDTLDNLAKQMRGKR